MFTPERTKKGVINLECFSDLSADLHRLLLNGKRPGESGDPRSHGFTGYGYLCDELLTKHPSLGGSVDGAERKRLAIDKLLAADAKCHNLNENGYSLDHIDRGALNGLLKSAQSLIGNLMKGYEHSLLGHCNFSNGASMGFKLQDAAPYKKFAGQATVTCQAYDIAVRAVKTDPHWYRYMLERYTDESQWFTRVAGNGVFTVPKNSKIDRAAAKEPCLNMYLQKGVGGFIRDRLRTVGIDLNDQSRNQDLARKASRDGSLATIDLSSASDSISERLVWDLLPPSMFEYLSLIRSSRAMLEGKTHRWSLFSTMGNGFTFELESMLFWALAKSVVISMGVAGDVSIYGDDIIVPTECSGLVLALLEAVGFTPNRDKTFTEGSFRESCGGHYLDGVDIKPFYVRRPITDVRSVMLICNRLRGWGTVSGISDPRLYEAWKWLSGFVPIELHGGCDTERSDYLVTPDAPRKRIHQRVVVKSGFSHRFSAEADNGRLAAWYHGNGGEILDTVSSNSFELRLNKEWITKCPMFPQELG